MDMATAEMVTSPPLGDCESDALTFQQILEQGNISTRYQPIVNLKSGDIIGYEALSRGPMDSEFYSPLALIDKAHELGLVWELEMLFRQRALEHINALQADQYMFINVDPDVINTHEFKSGLTREYLDFIGGKETNIVFEITERTAITDYEMFQRVLENYRKQGYQIAIDDVGAGYSGLRSITEIRPNFIKIDMDLIRNIDKDFFKQALIKAFVETATTTNITIIAEGIETKEELKTLILLGVHAGQGFLLQQPQLLFTGISSAIKQKIYDYNHISFNLNQFSQAYHYISNLVNVPKETTFESMTSCETIRNYMEKECLRRVCICDHEQPVGIVMKHNLDATMSGKYGYAVFSNRPIERIMNRKPLVVDYYTPINVVAKLAMGRCDDEIFDDVVVTQSSQFFGLVSMKNIFEYTLMYEKNSAKEQNPLTGLPGNTIINRVLTDLVSSESQACVMYVDINEFKIYNDVYGFEKGDVMIKSLAEMIKSEAGQVFPQTAFVGHIGGDDFLVVCSGSEVSYEMLANRIINRFSGERSAFFSSEHNAHHQIVSEDRYGITRTFSLTSLSISGIFGDLSSYKSSDRLSEALAKLKKIVKKKGESASIFINCTPSTEEMI
ncbi:MAG: hypothetical protein PWP38_2963 [Clostridiales bacterium]|jgi:diguanylate cyclase (GGDEF)-like protein|nr:hypothetical protein [Clostridiales bacterium]